MKIIIAFIVVAFSLMGFCFTSGYAAQDRLLVLSYHDVPKDVNLDNQGVDQASFVQQIEYLRTHGYHFVSMEDIIRANREEQTLPEKAVLLTFDDAYLSFYDFVYPLLKIYAYPCVLAVVTSWIDGPPAMVKSPLMNWEQLKEVAQSNLVEVANHTHNLHRWVVYNPQGNIGWAASSRIYDPNTGTYETDNEFRLRIKDDLLSSQRILKEKLGVDIRALVWPYGQLNQICIEEARKIGVEATFCLEDKLAGQDNLFVIPRKMIRKNPAVVDFIKDLKTNFIKPVQLRILQADLDLIYDPDPVREEKNLDRFIERVFDMRVNTVYLQAFSDAEGSGNISSVYFPNRILPMRADLFSRVVNQLSIRGIQVYAWMPMLSIVLPDKKENDSLRVEEFRDGKKRLSSSWYERLSPFSLVANIKLAMLYEDMAANARIDGVVFLDDGYLNDFEDFNPAARKQYRKIAGDDATPYQKLDPLQKKEWTSFKTQTLIELTERLKKAVLRYRPYAHFARTLYAPVLLKQESEEWFAQNYADSLKAYDYAVVMAYPSMEKVSRSQKWLKELVRKSKKYPDGLKKTVFKIQAYDWNKKLWINEKTLDKWLRVLAASGAQHLAYYPDNYVDNKPDAKIIRLMMSVEDFPFKRKLNSEAK